MSIARTAGLKTFASPQLSTTDRAAVQQIARALLASFPGLRSKSSDFNKQVAAAAPQLATLLGARFGGATAAVQKLALEQVLRDVLSNQRDSLSEMTQEYQFELQQLMDALTRQSAMLSRILKSAYDAQMSLSSNLKA